MVAESGDLPFGMVLWHPADPKMEAKFFGKPVRVMWLNGDDGGNCTVRVWCGPKEGEMYGCHRDELQQVQEGEL